MSRRARVTLLSIFVIAAFAATLWTTAGEDSDPVDQLKQQINVLTQRVVALEKEVRTLKTTAATRGPAPQDENAAAQAWAPIQALLTAGDVEQAKPQVAAFVRKYSNTRAGRRAVSLNQELAVVGKAMPGDWKIEKWYQGENAVDLDRGTTMLVFWETWCPHCRREVPKLQTTYDQWKEKGLQVVGLTKLTRSSTEKTVLDFIDQNDLVYPMAKEDGSLSAHFGVSGIPAVAVVKDGKVVWRGHPARVTEKLISGWVS